jgi:hypothetical protein
VVVFVQVETALVDASAWIVLATELVKFAVLGAIAVFVLRVEGVRPVELGLTRGHLVAAVAARVIGQFPLWQLTVTRTLRFTDSLLGNR